MEGSLHRNGCQGWLAPTARALSRDTREAAMTKPPHIPSQAIPPIIMSNVFIDFLLRKMATETPRVCFCEQLSTQLAWDQMARTVRILVMKNAIDYFIVLVFQHNLLS